MLHNYRLGDIETCLQCKRIVFVGDSTIRQIFWETAKKLDREKAEAFMLNASYHESQDFDVGCHDLRFVWDPYLNSTTLDSELLAYSENRPVRLSPTASAGKTAAIIVGGGLWHARYLGESFEARFKERITEIVAYKRDSPQVSSVLPVVPPEQRENGPDLLLFAPVPIPLYRILSPPRAETLLPDRIDSMNMYLKQLSNEQGTEVLWSFQSMTRQQKSAYEENGIHVVENIATRQADIILNLRCNSALGLQHYPFNKSCCHAGAPVNVQQITISFLLVVAIILTIGYTGLQFKSSNSRGFPKSSFSNRAQIAAACSFLGIAVHQCFIADRTLFLDKIPKTSDQGVFLLLVGITSTVGLLCFRSSVAKPEISLGKQILPLERERFFLSRSQTEEWKGWMQLIILAYHYTGMSKTLWVYQVVRVLVASYLFLTGYGHTLYFLRTNDFSLHRCASVFVRLNVLSCLLAFMMRTDYDFYYFPGLSSLWFLVVYTTIRIQHSTNILIFGVKVIVSAIILTAVMYIPGVLETFFHFPRLFCNLHVNVYEFRFRVTLDLYITYVGMIVGAMYHHIKSTPTELSPRLIRYFRAYARQLQISAIIISLITLPGYFVLIRGISDKYAYNQWHPLISCLPILSFVVLRNSTQRLRTHHSIFFAWLGRCSLETYILQYHIWLAADTKGLLSLGLWHHYPSQGVVERWADFAIITINFLVTSYETSLATGVITKAVVGEREHLSLGPPRGNRVELDLDKERLSPLPKGYRRPSASLHPSRLSRPESLGQPNWSRWISPLVRKSVLILCVMWVMNLVGHSSPAIPLFRDACLGLRKFQELTQM